MCSFVCRTLHVRCNNMLLNKFILLPVVSVTHCRVASNVKYSNLTLCLIISSQKLVIIPRNVALSRFKSYIDIVFIGAVWA